MFIILMQALGMYSCVVFILWHTENNDKVQYYVSDAAQLFLTLFLLLAIPAFTIYRLYLFTHQ
jgi:hypothetical protein